MKTRAQHLAQEHGLEYAAGDSVQVWWHNGWRDASVKKRIVSDEQENDESGGLDYVVAFTRFEPPEGAEQTVRFLEMMGGMIQIRGGAEPLDTQDHEVSVHVLRPKPQHDKQYRIGDLVQVRQPSEWIPGKVSRTRVVADDDRNCTQMARAGKCFTDVKHMLTQCKLACNATTHSTEYEVTSHMFRKWVTHERLLPAFSGLKLVDSVHSQPTDGCLLQGQVLVNRVPGLLVVRVEGRKHTFNMKATNLSHTVHHLSFGHSDQREVQVSELEGQGVPPRMLRGRNPLDGLIFHSDKVHLSHEHFVKIIRTTFHFLPSTIGFENVADMFHFTSSSSTHVQTRPHQAPSLTFSYDLSPMQVVITEETEGLFRFIVYIFAIIGGGFTVFGMIDSVVFHGDRLLRQKVGLGKAA